MDVLDIERKFKEDDKKTILIFNPLNNDVEWRYDGKPQEPIPSKENIRLKTSLAKHVGKHIVDLFLNTKEKNYPRSKAEKLVFP